MYDPLEFWEQNAEKWLSQKHQTKKDFAAIKKFINPYWKTLELGCGSGRWSEYLPNYIGVDISPTLVIDAKKSYPQAEFFHHDMRFPVPEGFDLLFTFTSWLHVSPEDIVKIKLPDTNYLFVEPYKLSTVEYCFNHNYEALFGVKKLKKYGELIIYGRIQ